MTFEYDAADTQNVKSRYVDARFLSELSYLQYLGETGGTSCRKVVNRVCLSFRKDLCHVDTLLLSEVILLAP